MTYSSIRSAALPCLVERDDADSDEKRDHDRGEDRVDDEDRGRARHFQAREIADERVQRERDDARGQEEKEDVPELRREQEREDEENGQDDQLDPSRDLDRRAGAGHVRDRTAEGCGRPAETLLRSEHGDSAYPSRSSPTG